jgi:hypothetical protein
MRSEDIVDDIRSRAPGSVVSVRIARGKETQVVRVRVEQFPRDEQLLVMASAANKALDFSRALMLCEYFEKNEPASNPYTARIRELKSSILERINRGE